MIFVYKKWDAFCKKLANAGLHSIPAAEVYGREKGYLVLKHDVETDVSKAYELARIEQQYGHRGSYYVQAYLLDKKENVTLLRQMQEMGHEVSYHYDVMDSCKGDLDRAIEEFETNRKRFEANGFSLQTLCQHGNPVVERIGYTSNRDFFRSERVRSLYPELSDIMVNFAEAHQTDYVYYSDAGRQFKMIYDPQTNDIVSSDDKNIVYKDTDALPDACLQNERCIISTHPHRWTASAFKYCIKTAVFKVVRCIAKLMAKIPFFKKIMSRYYYLAKKM